MLLSGLSWLWSDAACQCLVERWDVVMWELDMGTNFPWPQSSPIQLATPPLGQYLHSLSQQWSQCLSPGHEHCLSDPRIAANSKPHFRREHTEKWKECLNSWQSTLEMSWRNQTYRQTIFYSLTQSLCNMKDWNIALMTKTVIFICNGPDSNIRH